MMYSDIPFTKFLIALLILSIPPIVMSELGSKEWLYAYVFLILLSFAVYQYRGLQGFADFVGSM